MKLFAPKEIKEAKATELAKDVARTKTVKDALARSVTELNDLNARFEMALANQRVRWEVEERESTAKLGALRREVEMLEDRRKELLVPIDREVEKAHNLFKEAKQSLIEAQAQKVSAEELTALLQEKLDEVSDRETDLGNGEQILLIKQQAMAEQQAMTTRLSKELSTQWDEFFAHVKVEENKLAEDRRALELERISLETRENDIVDNLALIAREKIDIASQRATLRAALQEIKNQK